MTIFIYINMIAVRGVQLGPQVPPTSPVVHRDQQHYVCCEPVKTPYILFIS